MNKGPMILIIDDERQIRKLLSITLESEGYRTEEAENAREGLTMAAMHPPDLILLDLGLPDEDGQIVLKRLREWYMSPVIILSVRNDEQEIVRALDNGANDYLVKPFRTGELLARIRSALRMTPEKENNTVITLGNVTLDLAARNVKKNGVIIKLTATEYSLFLLMVQNEDKVLTHQFILKKIWGPGYVEQSQYLRVYVAQLRRKLEDDPEKPRMILTESGIGYRLTGEESNSL